jgi:hypothetical protein
MHALKFFQYLSRERLQRGQLQEPPKMPASIPASLQLAVLSSRRSFQRAIQFIAMNDPPVLLLLALLLC